MKTFIAAAIAGTVLTGTGFAGSMDYVDPFSSYVALGDSLTDDGKFSILGLPPPSFDGRFSNGITYAEHLAQDFQGQSKFTANLGLGGATAEDDNETDYGGLAPPITTLGEQVTALAGLNLTAPLGDNPLVSVLFGPNDIFQDLLEGSFIGEIGINAANAVSAGIQAIAALGPKFNDFVVMNIPDLSQIPRFAGGPAAPLAQAETLAFNAQLATNMNSLRGTGLNIVEVDLNAAMQKILADPVALGISNVTDPCTDDLDFTDATFNCTFTGSGFDLSLADDFLFIDQVHPNRLAQAFFADEIRAALTPIPLPAGLPLLVTGVAAFGVVRARRT